jgi:serine/threonine protein kinase
MGCCCSDNSWDDDDEYYEGFDSKDGDIYSGGTNGPSDGGETALCAPCDNDTFEKLYTIAEQIGKGGTAEVCRVVDEKTGDGYACKFVAKKRTTEMPQKIRSEIIALQKLEHENVCKLQAAYESGSTVYVVLEFMEGEDIGTYLHESAGPLPEEEVKQITAKVLAALEHIHSRGVVHRDVNPDSIMFADHDRALDSVRLANFGSSGILGRNVIRFKQVVGTPGYISPEMYNIKSGGYGKAVDLWSLGVTVYELLSGQKPFTASHFHKGHFPLNFSGHAWANISLAAQNFIQCLLQIEPVSRSNALQAMNHSWFTGKPLAREFSRPESISSNKVSTRNR